MRELTFYQSGKGDKKITNLQEIATLVNGLPKPAFDEIPKYLNCLKKIKVINQLIGDNRPLIDLDSFGLPTLKTVLNQWYNEDPGELDISSPFYELLREFRSSTIERICKFYTSSEETVLDLCGLWLTSLPDIFHLEPFQKRLIKLNLSSNKLTSLPDFLGNLQALTKLDLSFNELTSIPDFLGKLPLKELNLTSNKLTNLPNLGKLRALTHLYLRQQQTYKFA